jgi:AGCS family alanine or glycine:cation symporter
VFLGSMMKIGVVWDLADLMNGLMAIPNIFAVLLLSGVIAKETKKYAGRHIDDTDNTPIPTLKNADKGILG